MAGAEFGGPGGRGVGREVQDRHRGALGGEAGGDGGADSRAAAGDHGGLAGEREVEIDRGFGGFGGRGGHLWVLLGHGCQQPEAGSYSVMASTLAAEAEAGSKW